MKKTLNLILAVLIAGVGFSYIEARLTGTDPGTDAFCVGANGAEACIDANGSIIPTTTADADLGTSALVWNALHLTAGGLTDSAITEDDIASDAVSTAKIENSAVTTVKLYLDLPSTGVACVTTAKLLGTCSGGITAGACDCS